MGGHHGPQVPKVPDWRIYRVEDAPELMKVKKALAKQGLCDPWLRNEVWKYVEYRNKLTPMKIFKSFALKGFKPGAIAGAITAAIEYAFFPLRKPYGDDHGHH